MYQVLDQWNSNKVVCSGSKEHCTKYIQSNNNYQCNYSQLMLNCELLKYKITWLINGITQIKQLVNYKADMINSYDYFTIDSPIYQAILNGTFYIDLGYGKHHFKAEPAN